jgi:hypothetical protein
VLFSLNSFTGGSSGANKKSHPRYFRRNEQGVLVDETLSRQRSGEAARLQEEERKRKAASKKNKGKHARVNYREIDSIEYSTMRQGNWYNQPRDEEIENNHFWNVEQMYIFQDIYSTMKLRPMRPLDMPYLRSKPVFAEAMSVTQMLGLHHLMGLQCHYNTYYVQQFFSTLAIKGDDAHTMIWMTGDIRCESNFYTFADVLGYTFIGAHNAVGHRIHGPEKPSKDVLEDLYGPGYPVGKVAGLLPLYAQLVLLFRDNIAPSGGNNDAIRTSLVNLLYFASRAAHDNRVGQHFNLDVMDFIFNEMFDAMVSGTSIPYAPYIMMLIKHTLSNQHFSDEDCTEHLMKRPYVKKRTPTPAVSSDSFMADARGSGAHAKKPRVPSIAKEVKQLNWFQRNILCMNVDIRKE